MKTFNVSGNLGDYVVNLPENLYEITKDYLKECTDFITCAPNYALVGVVYKDALTLVLSAAKKKQPTTISVVPIFIKAGDNDYDFIKDFKLGDRCVIAASDLSIGNHINSPYNKITPDYIARVCEGDNKIYTEALMLSTPVCFLEFKIVPISAIHARLEDTKVKSDNPFVQVVPTTDNMA